MHSILHFIVADRKNKYNVKVNQMQEVYIFKQKHRQQFLATNFIDYPNADIGAHCTAIFTKTLT